jgi:3-dehydroquinate synthase
LDELSKHLADLGVPCRQWVFPASEESKSLDNIGKLWDGFVGEQLDRDSVIVALGGGVVGDLAGFAAATYQRGVRFVQVPTTLLAQVDSAIGGKNGINRGGKNLAGTIQQPELVLIDPEYLATLPPQHLASGLAEVIKYGFIRDPEILSLISKPVGFSEIAADAVLLAELVRRSVQIKVDIVSRDELESGERILLNYGHTVGHALEAVQGYRGVLHGEAVGLGMLAAATLASELGHATPELAEQTRRILRTVGLPTSTSITTEAMQTYLQRDKKNRAGRRRWVLVTTPGSASVFDNPDPAAVTRALTSIGEGAG